MSAPACNHAGAAAAPSADPAAFSSSSGAATPAPPAAGKGLESRVVALSGDHVVYLNLMAERYKLGSLDKAARCLVNYAHKDGDQRLIFSQYRCRHCGIKFPKSSVSLQLYPHQWVFLDRMREDHKITEPNNDGKPLRCLLDFTQEGNYKRGMMDQERKEIIEKLEADIFTKIRCNDPVCTHQH